ncbi:MAG: L-sorbose 1-phosphate reductase, partial [Spirochaetia bacterium]|nr:L-sorbose 1-phosphate reductase [Spirochaetia bacterium]
AIDYAIHGPNPPKRLVVTDIDAARLERARALLSVENALSSNVELHYVNTSKLENPVQYLLDITEGAGFDDVFVFAPVAPVVELADSILGKDGCLNFFAGPTDKQFSARMNFYNVHYLGTHVVGTSGGDTADMQKALDLMADNQIDPSVMITHIGGLDSAVQTTLDLPNIPGGKKLIYTHLELGLTSLEEIVLNKDKNSLFATLAPCIEKNQGLWSEEAEDILLQWIEDDHE